MNSIKKCNKAKNHQMKTRHCGDGSFNIHFPVWFKYILLKFSCGFYDWKMKLYRTRILVSY